MRICFLSNVSPFDPNAWSGITYKMYHTLRMDHTVFWTGTVELSRKDRLILKAWLSWQLFRRRKFTAHFILNARIMAKAVRKKINEDEYDCIVLGSGESELIAYLDTHLPIIYVADTTFSNMVDYYPWHTGLSRKAIKQGNRIEQRAIDRSFHLIYSSDWAATSAMKDYKASPKKISIACFGDSLSIVPTKSQLNEKKQTDTCHLLFIGTHWERKGGPIAFETFKILQASGFDCTLTVVGCSPDIPADNGLQIIPFLNKAKKEDTHLLDKIYRESDILLLPTRADCTPVVFSEAAAYGIPVITTDTGGIRTVIQEGLNGFCLPISAKAPDYASLILQCWKDKEGLLRMKLRSREIYEKRLNWPEWLKVFNRITAILPRQ